MYLVLKISRQYGGKMSDLHIFAFTFARTTECSSMGNLQKKNPIYPEYMYCNLSENFRLTSYV